MYLNTTNNIFYHLINYFFLFIEIKKQLRDQNQDADDRDIFKHYILPHFEIGFDELQGVYLLIEIHFKIIFLT